jgi:hypothetical protein
VLSKVLPRVKNAAKNAAKNAVNNAVKSAAYAPVPFANIRNIGKRRRFPLLR